MGYYEGLSPAGLYDTMHVYSFADRINNESGASGADRRSEITPGQSFSPPR